MQRRKAERPGARLPLIVAAVLGWTLAVAACSVAIADALTTTTAARAGHGLAMHGEPALPAGFSHFPYATPDAPKGGRLVQGIVGTFDSLNPLIVRGLAVQQIRSYVIESLMARGNDEPFTLYGLIAESAETNDARDYVTFRINPKAAFSDGRAILADDVLFSWQLLRTRGRPNHRLFYG